MHTVSSLSPVVKNIPHMCSRSVETYTRLSIVDVAVDRIRLAMGRLSVADLALAIHGNNTNHSHKRHSALAFHLSCLKLPGYCSCHVRCTQDLRFLILPVSPTRRLAIKNIRALSTHLFWCFTPYHRTTSLTFQSLSSRRAYAASV